VHKPSGKPVADAVRMRIDMAPDGMGEMVSPVAALPATGPGVYAFKTDLPMAGRYQFSIAAKVQGEQETVVGKVVFKAVK
jgi:YtkA-like